MRWRTPGIVGEELRQPRARHHDREPEQQADTDAELDESPADGARVVHARRAEEAPDHRLPGDGERVERQREEQQHLHADLVRGDGVVADARRDRGGGEQRDDQRGGAHHEAATHGRVGADPRRARPDRRALAPHRAPDDHEVRDRGAVLREHGAPRRACEPEVEAVHEQQLDQEVGDVRRHRDHERGARVLHPAEVAGAGQGEEQRGRAEDADAEVGDRVGARRSCDAPITSTICGREGEAEDGEHQPETDGQPTAVGAALGRIAPVAGAELAGDAPRWCCRRGS